MALFMKWSVVSVVQILLVGNQLTALDANFRLRPTVERPEIKSQHLHLMLELEKVVDF